VGALLPVLAGPSADEGEAEALSAFEVGDLLPTMADSAGSVSRATVPAGGLVPGFLSAGGSVFAGKGFSPAGLAPSEALALLAGGSGCVGAPDFGDATGALGRPVSAGNSGVFGHGSVGVADTSGALAASGFEVTTGFAVVPGACAPSGFGASPGLGASPGSDAPAIWRDPSDRGAPLGLCAPGGGAAPVSCGAAGWVGAGGLDGAPGVVDACGSCGRLASPVADTMPAASAARRSCNSPTPCCGASSGFLSLGPLTANLPGVSARLRLACPQAPRRHDRSRSGDRTCACGWDGG